MTIKLQFLTALLLSMVMLSCNQSSKDQKLKDRNGMPHKTEITAKDILGNPEYLAMSYGGYRDITRDSQPSVKQIKNDLNLLSAMGVKIIRTYNVQLDQAPNLLKAISELKKEKADFEMYVMLGAWIDCLNAWTDKTPDHSIESPQNEAEIARAVALVQKHPDIVKVLAVGNEAMVKWAQSYYVEPGVILKWVKHLQNLKSEGKLPKDLWITSSDDFSSWGGGDSLYHVKELEELINEVDYISMHTYPYHNTHYNPHFWGVKEDQHELSKKEKVDNAMERAINFAKSQYDSVSNYVKSIGVSKPIHIGETGWASVSDGFYGNEGSRATDEYKQGEYYKLVREWTNQSGISCFYFEAFNEKWKDAANPMGSENHFGLFKIEGQAKYAIWNLVDQGVFEDLSRQGNKITKTYNGNFEALMEEVNTPPLLEELIEKN